MSASEKMDIQIHDYVRRGEYREDLNRIETRVNSLAESQAMTSVAMQSMNNQMMETNKKLENMSTTLQLKLESIDQSFKDLATSKSFSNGLIKGIVHTSKVTVSMCAVILTMDYSGIIKVAAKYLSS